MRAKLLWVTTMSLLLVGCSANSENKANSQSSSIMSSRVSQNKSSQSSVVNTSELSQFKVSVNTAIKQYQQAFPASAITGISIEKQLGTYQYEVEGADDAEEHNLKLNAQSGKQLSKVSERLNSDERDGVERQKALNLHRILTLTQAVKIAEDSVKDTPAVEASLEKEAGQTYWDVQFDTRGRETSVKLNAQTGKVLVVEHDD
ncbi:PepSY domain-containing protein [Secundilactobacillus folii]|uniref:PepSY domain-containing protein n=1 Tax=Secundilactobacillus folii TaxID=2678357 RepID=A0A7X3C2V9_9LACO|nr:PepSY domain-containing protein [Secundilactobacillus folii]MTV82257.1 hypothetical protein [Secundilactobacillus folii]